MGAMERAIRFGADQHQDQDLRRFRAAMDAIADAIYLIDVESMALIDANTAACEMSGRSRADLLSMAPETLFSCTRRTLHEAWHAMIADGGRGDAFESRQARADGSWMTVEVRRHAQD